MATGRPSYLTTRKRIRVGESGILDKEKPGSGEARSGFYWSSLIPYLEAASEDSAGASEDSAGASEETADPAGAEDSAGLSAGFLPQPTRARAKARNRAPLVKTFFISILLNFLPSGRDFLTPYWGIQYTHRVPRSDFEKCRDCEYWPSQIPPPFPPKLIPDSYTTLKAGKTSVKSKFCKRFFGKFSG